MKVCKYLPPAPNWNSPKASALSINNNIFAYASSNNVILFNAETLQFKGTLVGHTARVNSLTFCDNLCASGSADMTIRCWDIVDKKQVYISTNHKSEIYALAWSNNYKFIVSGDKSGDLSAWNPSKNKSNKYYFIQSPIYDIAASPTIENSFAIGFQNGAIIIINIDQDLNGKIVRRLKGHDIEIQSLSWEIPKHQLDQPLTKYTFLVSGSRDKTACIWNVEEENLERIISLPHPMHYLTEQQKSRLFVATAWIPESNRVLVSTYMYQKFGNGHTRSVYTIVVYPCGTKAITSSMDQKVIKPIFSITCIPKQINDIDISVADPHRLAIACSDNNIRIWDIANILNPFRSLAFGTDLGNIGWYEIYNDKSKTFDSYHKNKVYAIEWCKSEWLGKTLDNEKSDEFNLILSCGGDGNLLLNDITKPKRSSCVNNMIREANPEWINIVKDKNNYSSKRSEVAINPNGRFLAVGNTDGSIEVYDLPSFKIIYHNIGHRATINKLKWCSLGSDDHTIMIHDFSNLENLSSTISVPTSSCKQVFGIHKKGITDLSWCPVDNKKLVSTSLDGMAIVWDLQKGIPISIFRGHNGRILSSVWSLDDEDLIFTGGDDLNCFGWRLSENPFDSSLVSKESKESDSATKSKIDLINDSYHVKIIQEQEQESSVMVDISKLPNQLETANTKIITPTEPTQLIQSTQPTRKAAQKKSKKLKNILPLTSTTIRRKNLQHYTFKLAKRLYGGDLGKALDFWENDEEKIQKTGENDDHDLPDSLFVDLFFDEGKKSRKTIEKEGGLEVNPGLLLELWSNDFSGLVKRNENNEGVSNQDWMILALSPLAGRDVWQSLMRLQAEKLAAKNDRHAAVLCWLACGEVYQAIEIYRKAEMYREAIALAKLRLVSNDPVLSELYVSWANQLEKEEVYEQAAMCHLASHRDNSIYHALNALSRRGDPSALKAAASLALMLEDSSKDERVARYLEVQKGKVLARNKNMTTKEETEQQSNLDDDDDNI
ncbi:5780_t:CDS:10 [Diversispora eburnea]|uniref:5780_t:CDS:1 n=1 Tax=Diversispora eburnea TaxID=1213867 RepID=A0A9N9BPP1_9GLOM|nr:5780_t:CDS:10 [Diversispora eburnea]